MKNKLILSVLITLISAGLLAMVVLGQDAAPEETQSDLNVNSQEVSMLGTGFTYQGYLTDGGSPANGSYDFRFSLYNAAAVGTQYGETDEELGVMVEDGIFTIVVSPGPGVFSTGGTRWLEIEVRSAGSGTYTTLDPRQEIRPVPQAIYAEFATNLVAPGDTVIYVSPYDAIESDGQSNLTFDAQGNGRLRIVRNVLGNDFVYIPVDVPGQIFGLGQQLALESLRFCYNGELVKGVIHGGIVRATVRQVDEFTMSNLLGEMFTPVLTETDECVTVEADTPQVVSGSLWIRFEIITGDLAPLELTEVSLRFTSDN